MVSATGTHNPNQAKRPGFSGAFSVLQGVLSALAQAVFYLTQKYVRIIY